MVFFKRRHIEVDDDRRKNTRIEFHMPVVILGIDAEAQIVDFSLEGFHIELTSSLELAIGQQVYLALRLPTERDPLRIKAKIVYVDDKGIGCRFTDIAPPLLDKLERCFNVFNATLPID
jgi:hypothetical protein